MNSEIFDCCLQQTLMPTILQRRHLLHTRCLPTQSDVREKLGQELANVVFDRMNPIEKCLMGVDKPLKGAPEHMWIDPRDDKIRLTPLPDNLTKALTHQSVLEIGQVLEKRLEMHEKYKIETAVREAVEFEQFETKLRTKFLVKKEKQRHEKEMKMMELKLLEQQKDRENYLIQLFEEERKSLIACLEQKMDQKVRETVASAVQMTRERLLKVYERRYCEALFERIEKLKEELKEEYEAKGLITISDARDKMKDEVLKGVHEENKRNIESLEVKHVAEVLHVICAEKTTANDKLEEPKNSHTSKWMKIRSLLDQLYDFCPKKCSEFCLIYEELQEELNAIGLNVFDTEFQKKTNNSSTSVDTNSVQSLNNTTCFPSSINWITQSSSESDTCLESCSLSLFTDLTPQVFMKLIIKHIRHNPKYMSEMLKHDKHWEARTIKVTLEKLMSFFLNGQNLSDCVNETLEMLLKNDEESLTIKDKELEESSVRFPGDKLISTKDSFELIPLPHVPEIPPVNTSKLIQVRDSLEIFSHRSKTISDGTSVDSADSSDPSPITRVIEKKKKRDTTSYLDFKPKAPKYFSLNLHRNRKEIKIPYKECTDEDIDQLFSECESKHPLKKHLPKQREREVMHCESSSDPKLSLKDEHYAKKLASLPIRDVLDIITTADC